MRKRKNKKGLLIGGIADWCGRNSRWRRSFRVEIVDKYNNTTGNGEKLFCTCRKEAI
ncbi:MAG: hypothetical protein ACLRMN_12425 [Mediterraneibacter gnavus]